MLTATFAALGAAALFAAAAALQHRGTGLVNDTVATVTGAGFVGKTLRHPLWMMGALADMVGLALHAAALRGAPLTLVQPLLVTGVVFALPFRRLLERRKPRSRELGWALSLVAGLVLFLVLATPTNSAVQPGDPIPAVTSAVLIGLGIVGCAVIGRRSTRDMAATALGTGAGMAAAASAAMLRETLNVFKGGLEAVMTTWPLFALVAIGVISVFLKLLAYQAGPLRLSLPALTITNPIVSMVVGVAIFDERFRTAPADLVGEAIGLLLVLVAASRLTRSDDGTSFEHRPGSRRVRTQVRSFPQAPSGPKVGGPMLLVAGEASESLVW